MGPRDTRLSFHDRRTHPLEPGSTREARVKMTHEDQILIRVPALGREDVDDTETVALIGDGHAFGKKHGTCHEGATLTPADQPLNLQPGAWGTTSH